MAAPTCSATCESSGCQPTACWHQLTPCSTLLLRVPSALPELPSLTPAPACSVNVTLGPREDRMLITGLHTVCDIHCITCNCVLGWKYEVRSAPCAIPVLGRERVASWLADQLAGWLGWQWRTERKL